MEKKSRVVDMSIKPEEFRSIRARIKPVESLYEAYFPDGYPTFSESARVLAHPTRFIGDRAILDYFSAQFISYSNETGFKPSEVLKDKRQEIVWKNLSFLFAREHLDEDEVLLSPAETQAAYRLTKGKRNRVPDGISFVNDGFWSTLKGYAIYSPVTEVNFRNRPEFLDPNIGHEVITRFNNSANANDLSIFLREKYPELPPFSRGKNLYPNFTFVGEENRNYNFGPNHNQKFLSLPISYAEIKPAVKLLRLNR